MKNFKAFNIFSIVDLSGSMLFGTFFIFLSLNTSFASTELSENVQQKNDRVDLQSSDVISANPVRVDSEDHVLRAEQWELARSGESILDLKVMKNVINQWLQNKDTKIEIQYPGGEEGEFWVQQLTDWLVSLGIPSDHMVVVPGSGADDIIKFGLIK